MSALDNYLRIHSIYCGVWEADGVPCSCDVEASRAELAALRAENAAMREALSELLEADEAWWYGKGDPRNGTPLLLCMDDARKRARTALGGSND